jgi:phosphoribosylanthranilate isomerase
MIENAGADFLGLPMELAFHKPDLTRREAIALLPELKQPPIWITYADSADAVVKSLYALSVRHIQLHGPIAVAELKRLKTLRPHWFLIKSLIVHAEADTLDDSIGRTIHEMHPWIDAFITDTFDPNSGASGATGRCHNWELSRQIARCSPKPLILAGGLNPENVADAISLVKPWGVDSHTGVEDALGNKDPEKVQLFIQNARNAFQKLRY